MNDIRCKGSTASSADLNRVRPITHRKFKASGLHESEYFTSLEVAKNNNSHVTTARVNLASMFLGELFITGSNFDEPEDSADSLFGSFDPVEVDFPRNTLKGSLGTDNKAKGNDDDG
ncbi:hypothetical protein FXO37_35027 [Capsicum annuum]|nr:hypothetical protein FXO37_35027 [Capsicum annuum]